MKRVWLYLMVLAVACLSMNGCATAPKSTHISAPPGGQGVWHTVRQGETLYRISKQYRVEVDDLMRYNHIYSPSSLATGQKLFVPTRIASTRSILKPTVSGPLDENAIRRIIGPKSYAYGWETITLHHSGTLKGGARLFDRDHRKRKMGGLFYHFVIGNGSSTPDGALEVGWRWRRQVKSNRAHDVNICVVGDFTKQEMSEAQLSTIVNLTRVLMDQYGIPSSRVRGHGDIKGRHTECPGKNFPMRRILSEISR